MSAGDIVQRILKGITFEPTLLTERLVLDRLHAAVDPEFKGADTELDKLIVEGLIDPLMHVVRNAFDHAIEPAEDLLDRDVKSIRQSIARARLVIVHAIGIDQGPIVIMIENYRAGSVWRRFA